MGDGPEDEAAEKLVVDAERWLADARIDEAAKARSRERWLRQQAAEDATFAGILLTLVESNALVALSLTDDTDIEGCLVGLGADYVVSTGHAGRITYVATSAIGAVRPMAEAVVPAGKPHVPVARQLWQVIALEAGERPTVEVRSGAAVVTGTLAAAGADVLTIAIAGRVPVYVPLASVTALSLLSSG